MTQRQKQGIASLLGALKPLLDLRGPVPLQLMTTFLAVASDEGKCAHDYARGLGIHRAAMSRYIHDLGDRARYGGPGLGLISFEQDPNWSNRQQIFLTEKGRAVVSEVFRNMRRSMSQRRDPACKKQRLGAVSPRHSDALGRKLSGAGVR